MPFLVTSDVHRDCRRCKHRNHDLCNSSSCAHGLDDHAHNPRTCCAQGLDYHAHKPRTWCAQGLDDHAHKPRTCCAQGLDDHAHKPTLRRLPKDKQVVASPAAAEVAKGLGFTSVIALDHGETTSICNGKLQITATPGICTHATSVLAGQLTCTHV